METRNQRSLRNLILSCMIVVPTVPFFRILGIGFYQFKAAIESTSMDRMQHVVVDHRRMIDSFIVERQRHLFFEMEKILSA